MFKYICNYQRREPSGMLPNQQSLTFDVWDTKLSRAWAEVIRRKLAETDVEPRDFSAHNSFPAFNNKYELFENISKNVQIARQLCPDLEWPTSIHEIDQSRLNYLHERFHEAQEFMLSQVDIAEKVKGTKIRQAFNKINHDIHSLENSIDFEKRQLAGNTNRQNYHVINFGLYDGDLRLPVTDDLRREFFIERALPDYKAAELWLGYATVGKNMLHCVINDDPQVVRDGMVRPQLDIGGETLFVLQVGTNKCKEPDHVQLEYRRREWEQNLNSFINRHQLGKYIDHTLPEHQYVIQPRLGVASSEHDGWTERDYYTLFTEYKLVSVELKEQN